MCIKSKAVMELDPGLPKSYAIFSINALRSGLEEKGKEVLEEVSEEIHTIFIKRKFNAV